MVTHYLCGNFIAELIRAPHDPNARLKSTNAQTRDTIQELNRTYVAAETKTADIAKADSVNAVSNWFRQRFMVLRFELKLNVHFPGTLFYWSSRGWFYFHGYASFDRA